MKTIIVCGGAGFIGSHLCEKLINNNTEVICIDNLITGDVRNIEQVYNYRNFTFINEDVSGHNITGTITGYIGDLRNIDEIYYLASIASPRLYLNLPMETINSNIYGMRNFLEIASRARCKFLYTSTSEVYGDPTEMPQAETYNGNVDPCCDRAIYDETKRVGETLVMAYHNKYRINTRIARIFNTYGPNMSIGDGRVIPEFIKQALSGQHLPVFGDGKQTRSFSYVNDTVYGLKMLMGSECNSPVNIGNPDEYYTVLEVANLIKKLTKSKSEIKFENFISENDPMKRMPDITKARKLFGFMPRVKFESGLQSTIDYFREIKC